MGKCNQFTWVGIIVVMKIIGSLMGVSCLPVVWFGDGKGQQVKFSLGYGDVWLHCPSSVSVGQEEQQVILVIWTTVNTSHYGHIQKSQSVYNTTVISMSDITVTNVFKTIVLSIYYTTTLSDSVFYCNCNFSYIASPCIAFA